MIQEIQSQQATLVSLEADRAELQSLLEKNQATLESKDIGSSKLDAQSRVEAARQLLEEKELAISEANEHLTALQKQAQLEEGLNEAKTLLADLGSTQKAVITELLTLEQALAPYRERLANLWTAWKNEREAFLHHPRSMGISLEALMSELAKRGADTSVARVDLGFFQAQDSFNRPFSYPKVSVDTLEVASKAFGSAQAEVLKRRSRL